MVYQDKFSKFNQLIANCVIYSTALDITATTNGLVAAGHPVDPVDLATVTPLITHTVRRFGDWHLDLTHPNPVVMAIWRCPSTEAAIVGVAAAHRQRRRQHHS
jgi:hypothetical protein